MGSNDRHDSCKAKFLKVLKQGRLVKKERQDLSLFRISFLEEVVLLVYDQYHQAEYQFLNIRVQPLYVSLVQGILEVFVQKCLYIEQENHLKEVWWGDLWLVVQAVFVDKFVIVCVDQVVLVSFCEEKHQQSQCYLFQEASAL